MNENNKKMVLAGAGVVVVLILVVWGIMALRGGQQTNQPSNPTAAAVPAPYTGPVQAPLSGTDLAKASPDVSINDGSFSPGSVTIKQGDRVIWVNKGTNVHAVTSDGGLFQSLILNPGQRYQFTFTVKGTFTYHDSTNTGMTGTVIVQ
ncbi:cupredoxin domain-containing protein [Patescibacteria group bacterium]|nr:cupredoxin domain-containing protein [Patescibacteria group bacterium]